MLSLVNLIILCGLQSFRIICYCVEYTNNNLTMQRSNSALDFWTRGKVGILYFLWQMFFS